MSFPPTPEQMSPVTPSSPIRKVFIGQGGLRAGWRFLIFVLLLAVCLTAIRLGLRQVPPLRQILH